ncbi:MAG: hypothetical protein ACK56I_11705, partial [bacterium]
AHTAGRHVPAGGICRIEQGRPRSHEREIPLKFFGRTAAFQRVELREKVGAGIFPDAVGLFTAAIGLHILFFA